jgi:hypothetical protein
MPSSSQPSIAALIEPSICDLQEQFRPAIHEFPKVVATAQKLLKASTYPIIGPLHNTRYTSRLLHHLALSLHNCQAKS